MMGDQALTVSDETVHLLNEGSLITACCKRHAIDARIKLGTYDPEAATCPKPSDSNMSDTPKD